MENLGLTLSFVFNHLAVYFQSRPDAICAISDLIVQEFKVYRSGND
jgi:hypothetical protein